MIYGQATCCVPEPWLRRLGYWLVFINALAYSLLVVNLGALLFDPTERWSSSWVWYSLFFPGFFEWIPMFCTIPMLVYPEEMLYWFLCGIPNFLVGAFNVACWITYLVRDLPNCSDKIYCTGVDGVANGLPYSNSPDYSFVIQIVCVGLFWVWSIFYIILSVWLSRIAYIAAAERNAANPDRVPLYAQQMREDIGAAPIGAEGSSASTNIGYEIVDHIAVQ
jgi:hypothetical protein